LAALTIVVTHYFYGFWMVPGAIAGLIGAPALEPRPNAFTQAIDTILPYGFLGHFGVALFFLISGFVIPFALMGRGRMEFAIERFFRLWPTYAAGLTLTVLAVIGCSRWYGGRLPFEPSTYFLQLLFVRDLFWVPSIDAIVWTLEIEIKFYILAMVLASSLRAGRLLPLLTAATLIAGVFVAVSFLPGWLNSASWFFRPLYALSHSGMVICYMLIGTVFNFLYRGIVPLKSALLACGFLFAATAVQWPVGVMAGATRSGLISYGIALAVFAISYFSKRHFRNTPPLLAWLADVSYPLYVVHGVAGYVVMRLAIDAGASPPLVMALTTVIAFATAWILHKLIEVPTHAMGKRIATKLTGRMQN
jgi:peptidoglycan/LPS O-acetylase OafA/YrhL